ncbi:MAG: VOC family protein [Gammaproteobacteria bacterium]|nr:VOC family protein [Gammaproteobacteria bacterium]NNC97822.1 VOC family protein [Gammaproteobacteria bacterium]NNM13695.1 VOC family protein [Gammaproteobacteria bacterium]
MQLGISSISLAVNDIHASKAFYGKLGFSQFAGDINMNYLIMRNGDATIGLFQGMFDNNILTFNPGWDAQCNALEKFTDVRELKKTCIEQGLEIINETNADKQSGPASFSLIDPDGNPVLIDQHV